MTDPFPYQEIPHEKLSEIAVNLARERDRLAVRLAAYEERFGHLDHAPLQPAYARSPLDEAYRVLSSKSHPLDADFVDDYDHLVEKRRRAEGADMPHPDDRANDPRWPLAMCVVVIVALSAAGWMAVPWIWRGVVWAWEVVS